MERRCSHDAAKKIGGEGPAARSRRGKGCAAGLCYERLPRRKINIYASLLIAMVAGRLVWGAARFVMGALQGEEFGFAAFWAGAAAGSVPGIIAHIALIPPLVMALERAKLTIK